MVMVLKQKWFYLLTSRFLPDSATHMKYDRAHGKLWRVAPAVSDTIAVMSLHACVSVCQTGPRAVARVHAEVMLWRTLTADLAGPMRLAITRGLWAGVGVVWAAAGVEWDALCR